MPLVPEKKKNLGGVGGYSVTFDSTAVVRAPRTWGVYKPLQRYHWFLKKKKKKGGWGGPLVPALSPGLGGAGGDAVSGLGCMSVLILNIVYTLFLLPAITTLCALLYTFSVYYIVWYSLGIFPRDIENGQKFFFLFFGFFC